MKQQQFHIKKNLCLKIKDFVLVFLCCLTNSFLLAQPKENPTLFLANETVVVGSFQIPENQTESILAFNHATIHVYSATVFYYNPNLTVNLIVVPEELVQNDLATTTNPKLETQNSKPKTLTNNTTPYSSLFGFYQQMCCVVPTSSFTKKAVNTNHTKANPKNYIAFCLQQKNNTLSQRYKSLHFGNSP